MRLSLLESFLLKLRPALLAEWLKIIFRVRRRKLVTMTGHTFFVDPVSNFGAELAREGIYEPDRSTAFLALLRPRDVFFDIGANEGYFSILASAAVKKEGKVFLVEPQSRLQAVIQENVYLNDCDNIELVRAVFLDREGNEKLNLSWSLNSGSSSVRPLSFLMKKERVTAMTFDTFVSKHGVKKIRLIKMDCEGSEFSILSGAKNSLREHLADFISVDYHSQTVGEGVVKQIDGLLRDCGYELAQIASGPWFYYLPERRSDLSALGPLRDIAPK